MNWISNFVRPKIRALVQKEDVPDKLWEKCQSCDAMIFHREMDANGRVCPHCGHHLRIGAKQRLDMLFDDGSYLLSELKETPQDPLKFRDRRRYSERLKDAQTKTGHSEAILVAHGKLGGRNIVIAAFDFGFMGGSMGIAVGEGLLTAARLAVVQEAPLLVIPSSGGARMQEGILSLMQMPRSVIAVDLVKEAGLPYIVLLTDPTTGGVSASFAMLGDIAIAEPGAVIGFAGLEHGMVDMVVHRRDLRETLIRTLSLLCDRTPAAEVLSLPAGDGEQQSHGKSNSGTPPGGDEHIE
jgi:acetyl-CoA carboxylase carboxyl transferase subunit beta